MPAPSSTASARRSAISAGRSTWVRSRPPARAITGAAATGTITFTQVSASLQFSVIIGGVSPWPARSPCPAVQPRSSFAETVRAAIDASPDYNATRSSGHGHHNGSDLGNSENGKTIVKPSTTAGTTAATATITVNSSGDGEDVFVDAITVDHPTLGADQHHGADVTSPRRLRRQRLRSQRGTYGNRIKADTGTDQSNERTAMATGIQDCISEATGTHGFTATRSGNVVTVRAPLALGDTINGKAINVVKGTAKGAFAVTAFSGGVSARITTTGSASMNGGIDAAPAGATVRVGVGYFSRVNIDPSDNTYDKAPGRIDCVGSVCTYAEEMTNFANWYAYYRTRMQMMKSASGRAFHPDQRHLPRRLHHHQAVLGSGLGQHRPGGLGAVLRIADFDKNHKDDWYKKFYEQKTGGGTPCARRSRASAGSMPASSTASTTAFPSRTTRSRFPASRTSPSCRATATGTGTTATRSTARA